MQEGPIVGHVIEQLFLVVPFVVLALLAALTTLKGPAPRPALRSLENPRCSPEAASREASNDTILAAASSISPAATSDLTSPLQAVTGPVATPTAAGTSLVKPGDKDRLAAYHLERAKGELAVGRTAEAADALRDSIRAAMATKNQPIHAEARLELAELCRAAGDLTSACEHWQIARSLFHELKNPAALAAAEGLMRRHGCPTDWVLNDF